MSGSKKRADGQSVTISNLRKVVQYLDGRLEDKSDEQIAKAVGIEAESLRKLLRPAFARLGVDLSEISGTHERLRQAAVEFHAKAKRVINDYDALFAPKSFGILRVRVGAYPSIATLYLSRHVLPRLNRIRRSEDETPSAGPFPTAFPRHQLEWVTAARSDIIRDIASGQLDFGIVDRDATQQHHDPSAGGLLWTPLFDATPFGFLYRHDDARFSKLVQSKSWFDLDGIGSHCLIMSRHDAQAIRFSQLTDPNTEQGTRFVVGSYREVYEAVRASAGVGIGFTPKASGGKHPVRSLPFASIRCPKPRHQETVDRLAARGSSRFGVYARRDGAADGLEVSDAARFVLTAVEAAATGYQHDYVSDPDRPSDAGES